MLSFASIGNLSKKAIDYWSGLPVWSVDEATALSFGKRGEIDVTARPGSVGLTHTESMLRRKQIHLAVTHGELATPIRPCDFLYWAHRKGIEMHPALISAIEAQRQPGDKDGLEGECRRLMARTRVLEMEVARLREDAAAPEHPKVITSLEVLVICMAIDKFGYKPGADRQPSATRLILNAIQLLGLKLTAETILARLQVAERHLKD